MFINEGLVVREGVDKVNLKRSGGLHGLQFLKFYVAAIGGPFIRDLVDEGLRVFITGD